MVKLIKLTQLSLLSMFVVLLCNSIVFAAGEDVTVLGDTQGYTLSLTPQASIPATGSEGELIYSNDSLNYEDEVCVWDGSQWQPFSGVNKNVATVIVGVRKGSAGDSLDADRADIICDGSKPDNEFIQDAINLVPEYDPTTGTGGGVVYLLDGTYIISGSIDFDNGASDGYNDSVKALIGTGAGTVLQAASGLGSLNFIDVTNVSGVLISRISIDGTVSRYGDDGIDFNSVTHSKIDRVWIENSGDDAIDLDGSSNNIISNSLLQSSNSNGIELDLGSNNTISGNQIISSQSYGIYLYQNSSNNLISKNNVQSNANHGIYLRSESPGNSPNNNIISNNNLQLNGDAGIRLYRYCYNNIISGNSVSGNTGDGIDVWRVYSNNVSGNNIQLNKKHGIFVDPYSNYNNISGNNISENGESGNYDGIRLETWVGATLIASNRIYDSSGSGYGINIVDSTCEDNYLAVNFIDGEGFTAKINDQGTGTKYTGRDKITLERRSSILTLTATDQIDPATNPRTYIPIAGSGGAVTLTTDPPIVAGKAEGDILILEGTGNAVTIPTNTSNTKFPVDRTLDTNDTLTLTWDGHYWVELSYSNN